MASSSDRPAVNPVDTAFTAAYAARQADLTWGPVPTTGPLPILNLRACANGGQCQPGTTGPWKTRCIKCGLPI